ncbi:MBL fold hydrolase [Burkholderia ambifaria]|jgi:glyoxylase-like metal-dependent hydrolase (beta-lactamase superfamily II)|uniref:N-acyl homoserine lactonase family protein n=1 Tax=Burkholderia ambifaria TaxID=152480 RepID=UPI000CFF79A0|nr:N-acyl homoserine lactonase family protein [Burkholderia ambifaria]PRG09641.1 MBL fold hydrolase [Burkholderia ambifaria]
MSGLLDQDSAEYEVFALRYATHDDRRSGENYLGDDPHDDISMPLDFYVWVIRGMGRTVLVDTGFDASTAARRKRRYLHSPVELLGELGIDAAHVDDVIITHMHYDHAGNIRAFPAATLHIQDAEMAYCTGRCMCHEAIRKPFEARDVCAAIERLHAGRVRFADGDHAVASGIHTHLIGGHTAGLQVVRVRTARGHVVLASDAAHYWDHIRSKRPFPIVFNVARMLDGHAAIEALADGPDHIIPGHDPAVRQRFPRWNGHPDIVALHASPLSDAHLAVDASRVAAPNPATASADVQLETGETQ